MNKAEEKIIRDEFRKAIDTQHSHRDWYLGKGIKSLAEDHYLRILTLEDLKRSIFDRLGIAE